MLNSLFVRGLLLGLLVGFVVGHFVSSAAPPTPGSASAEVDRLRHQLEAARRERDGLERNIEEFRGVADKMTEAFNDLERRFKTLAAKRDDAQADPTP